MKKVGRQSPVNCFNISFTTCTNILKHIKIKNCIFLDIYSIQHLYIRINIAKSNEYDIIYISKKHMF